MKPLPELSNGQKWWWVIDESHTHIYTRKNFNYKYPLLRLYYFKYAIIKKTIETNKEREKKKNSTKNMDQTCGYLLFSFLLFIICFVILNFESSCTLTIRITSVILCKKSNNETKVNCDHSLAKIEIESTNVIMFLQIAGVVA